MTNRAPRCSLEMNITVPETAFISGRRVHEETFYLMVSQRRSAAACRGEKMVGEVKVGYRREETRAQHGPRSDDRCGRHLPGI